MNIQTPITRRTMLGGIAAIPFSANANPDPAAKSLEETLVTCTAAERVRDHSNALMDAMAELHPNKLWRCQIDHDNKFALITARHGSRVTIDDGSPLLADDVTGTKAFASWEARQ